MGCYAEMRASGEPDPKRIDEASERVESEWESVECGGRLGQSEEEEDDDDESQVQGLERP